MFFLLLAGCGVSFIPAGEVRFDGSDTVTAVNGMDLDSNGRSDLLVGISTSGPDDIEGSRQIFSTLFIFEETGKSWKYLWKSAPLIRSDRRLEPAADEVEEILVPMDTNSRRLLVRTRSEKYCVRFEEGHYFMEPCGDVFPGSFPDAELGDYFKFPFDKPYFFMIKSRQYLVLERENAFLEIYRFRPEAEPPFIAVGRLRTGPVTALCVFKEVFRGREILCAGRTGHALSFYRVSGL